MKEGKKIKPSVILISAAVFIATYLIVISFLIYFYGSNSNLVRGTAKIIPYPAAVSGAGWVSYNKLKSQLDSAKRFYENQDFSQLGLMVDFSTSDGKKRLKIKEKNILTKLIENLVIEAEAKRKGIKLTKDVIDQAVDRKLKEYGSEDYLRDNLQKLYGWSIEDFKENIVKPDMYKEQLFESIKKDDSSYSQAKNKINQAKKNLDDGKNFEETAKKYSEGQTAASGGNLGWFSVEQMLSEAALEVVNLEKEQTSEIIESSIGYHIVKLTDIKEEEGIKMFEISQIFVRTKSFSDWLLETEKNRIIYIPLREFEWNSETGQVEFKSEEMKKFEENLMKDLPNDPSILF